MIFDFNNIVSYFFKRNIKIAEKKIELHKWFAWYPVEVGYCKWVWFSMVLRKYKSHDWDVEIFSRRYKEPEYFEIKYIKDIRNNNE